MAVALSLTGKRSKGRGAQRRRSDKPRLQLMLEAEAAEEEQEEGGLPMIARFPLPAHGKLQSKDAVGGRPTSAPSPASPKALEPPTPTVRDDGTAAMSVADFEREMERWIAQGGDASTTPPALLLNSPHLAGALAAAERGGASPLVLPLRASELHGW